MKYLLIIIAAVVGVIVLTRQAQAQTVTVPPLSAGFNNVPDSRILPASVRQKQLEQQFLAEQASGLIMSAADWLQTKTNPFDVTNYDYTEGGSNPFSLL